MEPLNLKEGLHNISNVTDPTKQRLTESKSMMEVRERPFHYIQVYETVKDLSCKNEMNREINRCFNKQ